MNDDLLNEGKLFLERDLTKLQKYCRCLCHTYAIGKVKIYEQNIILLSRFNY